jgi:putative ATP-binding cassette transporter
MIATLTDDIPSIATALTTLPIVAMHIAIVTTSIVYLGWLSWELLLFFLAFTVFGIIAYNLPLQKATRFMEATRIEFDNLVKHFQSLTDGIKELKLSHHRRNDFLDNHLEVSSRKMREQGIWGDSIFAFAGSFGHLLAFLFIGSLLFLVPNFKQFDTEVLTGFCLVIIYILTPLEVLSNCVPLLTRAFVAIQTVESLGLDLEKESETQAVSAILPEKQLNKLEINDVSYTYYSEEKNETFKLGPINLEISPGELVMLVGGNGSGKTTLAKILTGLYTPETGTIECDGELVTDQNREAYRQLFSVVFSDFYLFDYLLGIEKANNKSMLEKYLEKLDLSHKVKVEEGKFSTLKLSQGQRKRLALLTAYVEDRPIFVFDEWAADQDPVFKDFFYNTLLQELKEKNKALLVISHDDRYFDIADRILKLEGGHLIDHQTALPPKAEVNLIGSGV